VVEAEQLVRMTAIEMVENADFEAIEAVDANGAIRILASRNHSSSVHEHPDARLNGRTKLPRAVRDRWPPVALIVTSGRTDISASDLPSGGISCKEPSQVEQLFGNWFVEAATWILQGARGTRPFNSAMPGATAQRLTPLDCKPARLPPASSVQQL
jgi:hypothetical protein